MSGFYNKLLKVKIPVSLLNGIFNLVNQNLTIDHLVCQWYMIFAVKDEEFCGPCICIAVKKAALKE